MSEPLSPKTPPAPPMTLKISDEVHHGVYANKMIIAHSGDEFIFDFIADFPPGPQVVARIVTTPTHAASFFDALGENLSRFQDPGNRPPGSGGTPFSA